ncbi:MAG: M15 family metallopeptidase [Ruminococcus sp.]|nr:M15 family metallopeptidase [Ruminococcus sp.]
MSNGNRRRSRRRYKLRYDRVIAVALVLIVLIVIITSCSKGCSKDDDDKNTETQSSVVDELTSGSDENADATAAEGDTAADAVAATAAETEYTIQSVEYAQINMGDLILVNSLHPYTFAEGDTNLVTVYENRSTCYSVKDNEVMLDSNVITQLNTFMEAYYAATSNTDLRIITGYRSLEVQNDKYNSGLTDIAGGYSEYHTGRAIDVGIFPEGSDSNYYSPDYSETINYGWFNENASSYGFILRYPEGKESSTGESSSTYTYRYVGIPHAVYMAQNNLCLEEYIDQIKSYNSTNTLKITNGTSQYEVYYVAANVNDVTDVPVPSTMPYTISGNNVDGFIVTVTVA